MYSNNLNFPTADDFFVKARRLHKSFPVTDSHFDLPAIVSNYNAHGICDVTERFFLKDWMEGGFNLIGCSIYIRSTALSDGSAYEIAHEQIASLKKDIEPLYPLVQIVSNKKQLDDVIRNNYTGLLMYFEGLEPIEENINYLDEFYGEGIRGASLTWSRNNLFATGCCKAGQYENRRGHITEQGIHAIRKMEQLNMFIDISHLNDDGISDIEILTNTSYLATHSNSRSLCDNYRNLTDTQIQHIVRRGGIIGINAYKYLNISKNRSLYLNKSENMEISENTNNMTLESAAKLTIINDNYADTQKPDGLKSDTQIQNNPMTQTIHALSANKIAGASIADNHFLNAMSGQIMYLYNQGFSQNIAYGFDLCEMLTASEQGSTQKISSDDTLLNHSHAVQLTAKLLQNCIPEKDVCSIIGGNFVRYIRKYLPDN